MTKNVEQPIYAAIDAGGTAFKCMLARGPQCILEESVIPVSPNPNQTLEACTLFFNQAKKAHGAFKSLGLACFGPVCLDQRSPRYGHIGATPKPGWEGVAIKSYFEQALGVPVGFETDVNGALLAEHCWGAGRGSQHLVYVTVGTGIGGGVMLNGQLVHGRSHPEIGHMRVPSYPADDFAGCCTFHQDCLEGLASGPALALRAGKNAELLACDHPAWEVEAFYLAAMCVNLYLCYTPQKIILGGGVMQHEPLLAKVRAQFQVQLNGYAEASQNVEEIIQKAALGTRAGVQGALILAQQASLIRV